MGHRLLILKLHVALGLPLASVSAIGADPAPEAANAGRAKPNIVLILADNFGYGELGCYGGGVTRGAPTARIDRSVLPTQTASLS